MIELKFYRHKEYKDLYLKRSSYCGGNANTPFYEVTKDVFEAIRSLDFNGDDFMSWYHTFPENKTKVIFMKEMEFDGYKGILKKEVWLPISGFELVTLREVEE